MLDHMGMHPTAQCRSGVNLTFVIDPRPYVGYKNLEYIFFTKFHSLVELAEIKKKT